MNTSFSLVTKPKIENNFIQKTAEVDFNQVERKLLEFLKKMEPAFPVRQARMILIIMIDADRVFATKVQGRKAEYVLWNTDDHDCHDLHR